MCGGREYRSFILETSEDLMLARLPSILPGTPVIVGSTVGHVSSFKRGSWTGYVLVTTENPWDSWVSYWMMHRDSIRVLEGPVLPPDMLKTLRVRSVMRN
jgi:hypothetical protein